MTFEPFDRTTIAPVLDRQGWAMLPGLLGPDTCAQIAAVYESSVRFRSTVVMARHG
jgi:hypothetical protein